jgi:hypothetical protein
VVRMPVSGGGAFVNGQMLQVNGGAQTRYRQAFVLTRPVPADGRKPSPDVRCPILQGATPGVMLRCLACTAYSTYSPRGFLNLPTRE